jgi:thymidine phosphorylase
MFRPGEILEGIIMVLTQEVIARKRDGMTLEESEIRALVEGVSAGSVSDAQIAAFAMAVWFQGLDIAEQMALTLAMRDSGETLKWGGLNGPLLDKHSTGGVGDLVSLVLGPLLAACGAFVPMISGRGLGHTGGTLDKLESIPGFHTTPDVAQFQDLVKKNGVAIIGQTAALAPADRRFYAVRDVTATVASIPLIVASILSKKLAEGLDGLVMDVKLGSGAFMREPNQAHTLAGEICRVSAQSGLPCTALITDMNLPLAWSAGNALEVHEAIDYLTGIGRHPRLDRVVRALSSEMLYLGGLAPNLDSGQAVVASALDSGAAAECFSRMVANQDGPSDLLDNPDRYLPSAPVCRPVFADETGYVKQIDTESVGLAVVQLGGGRRRAEDRIDHSVGLTDLCTANQELTIDSPIATIHATSELDWQLAAERLKSAVRLSPDRIEVPAVIRERVEGVKAE